jgi:SPP1 family predicted phage head-tail adaptor
MNEQLNQRIEIGGPVKDKNTVGAWMYKDGIIKKIWASVKPRSGNFNDGASNTKYSETQFKIRIRKSAYPSLNAKNWFKKGDTRFEIKYILPDYQNNEYIDAFCNVIEE